MSQSTEAEPAVRSFQEHVDALGSKNGEVSIRSVECSNANIKKFEARFTFVTINYPKRPEAEGGIESPMIRSLLIELEVPIAINTASYDTVVDLCSDITLVIAIPHVTIPGVNIPDFEIPSSHRTKLATKSGNLRQGPIVIDLRVPSAPFNVSVTVSLTRDNTINVDLNSGHATLRL
ncbi:hypothetical protein V8B97DRAFT_1914630 [Scleroderma yunnanense]